MNLVFKLFSASVAIGAVSAATFPQPLAATPIALLADLRNVTAADVQTVQWRDWNSGTQYGTDYDYYGPRYRSNPSENWNPGERSNTETQYGSDYGYYGSRYRSSSPRTRNPGERSSTVTQCGPDYGYYGPR
jgi:hypothetical protein